MVWVVAIDNAAQISAVLLVWVMISNFEPGKLEKEQSRNGNTNTFHENRLTPI